MIVFPFRIDKEGHVEFLILLRSDEKYWQAIAGGGDEGELPLDAAIRESWEEAGIPRSARFIPLHSVASVPVHHFKDREHWPKSLSEIPEYSFAVECPTDYIVKLSAEHTDIQWLSYEKAFSELKWESNKTALSELNRKIQSKAD